MSNWANQWVLLLAMLAMVVAGPVHAQDVVRLNLGGDEIGVAMFEPELRVPVRGALLILADEGQSASANLLAALGESLTPSGWAVMSLGLEAPPYPVQQARRYGDDRNAGAGRVADEGAETVMIDVMDDGDLADLESEYNASVQNLLGAAKAELKGRGYERVVLAAVGQGAVHVARFAGDNDFAGEMVWIAPRFHSGDESVLSEALAGQDALSVLHLYSSREDLDALPVRPGRRMARLKKAGVGGYQTQVVAMGVRPEVRDARALANRMQAWLKAD
ncbi:DUF3530 family protein [Marinobacter sp. NP-4(2019)]|uniref:DUF3530 family protein n=1 Tax=Marinobacter sp. NP-4(2019) TaxID=2488665 RepID=UPI000FC3CE05|nr:DUF3530 family protein [Marinobacter sp. NP-4(2019)]AZT85308.1 DUF3530 family protein [Marinobacter sp. NP-4(2019)]